MMQTSSPSTAFHGFHFVLFGFDSINERQVRAKLINGGGVDAGQPSRNKNYTHVIVDKIVYDDPICVAARNDRKTLVTGLWVDHSYNLGMAADATSIMYRPLRDLNGISGAKNLIICLTGYQRQDRDDIMTMASLMGAQFSKPLVANKVTHLICYKFEGEKYELAYKLKKIKLVNHRWLEDSLRDWKLLPEDNYNKSSYELEMMEAEAKDSEEDANEKQSNRKMAIKSPEAKTGNPKPYQLSKSNGQMPNMRHNTCELGGSPRVLNMQDMLTTPNRNNGHGRASTFDSNCISKVPMCQNTSSFNDATSVGLRDAQDRSPSFRKEGNDLASVFRSSETPCFDAKLSTSSSTWKTPRKSPSSICSGKSGNIGGTPKVELGGSTNFSAAKVECTKYLIGSGHGEDLLKGAHLRQRESSNKKQKLDVSSCSLRHHNMIFDAQASWTKCPSASSNIQRLDAGHGLPGISNCSPLGNPDHSVKNVIGIDATQKLHTNASTSKSPKSGTKSFAQSPPYIEKTPDTEKNKSKKVKRPETSFTEFTKPSSANKPEGGDFGLEKSDHAAVRAGCLSPQQLNKQVPSFSDRELETQKTGTVANLVEIQEGNDNLITKPGRKKTIAKKSSSGSRKLRNSAYQKGSIYSTKGAAQRDPPIGLSGERVDHKKPLSADKLESSVEIVNVIAVKGVDMIIGTKFGNKNGKETNLTDDGIESPEEIDGHNIVTAEKVEMVNMANQVDDEIEVKPEAANLTANTTDPDMYYGSKEGNNAAQPLHEAESSCKRGVVKGKVSKGQNQPSDKTDAKSVPPVSNQAESKKFMGKEIRKPYSAGPPKTRPLTGKNIKSAIGAAKESKVNVEEDRNLNHAQEDVGRGVAKSVVSTKKTKQKSRKSDPNNTPARNALKKHFKPEPVWFMLSGHRQQRKEFQQVIKRLKGKFCRDSHQWSYQATHFITPSPIRRTEKFFAAAATGRWILKTDYLPACSQAGRFLEEEPYEWHKNSLSEDGAINFEAPRKWRQLRERTGHGALYGMRILIYGECIAPSLDTLKRVVKAGDGTILATSPPYTRFLASGVDYAIISPGMPRADKWVQEFLQHEIPCVVADYLVEYVCKAGYALDKHVLYETHAWAEKSFANLLRKAEEIVEDLTPSAESSTEDTACEVCGCRDREEVMLICGDENGSVGCGAGMHMDCCDPPLEDIPEEDWFCPDCRRSNRNSSKRRKRAASLKT